jgi:hypothetical protein
MAIIFASMKKKECAAELFRLWPNILADLAVNRAGSTVFCTTSIAAGVSNETFSH